MIKSLGLILGVASLAVGCSSSADLAEKKFLELNKTNVAKVRTCFMMYASRNGWKSPKNQKELVDFLNTPGFEKNLKRSGINPKAIEDIFISERDNEPLKIRWGSSSGVNGDAPIAFEATGVDGVRLVSANVVLRVKDDQEYQRLWKGQHKAGPNDRELNEIQEEMAGN